MPIHQEMIWSSHFSVPLQEVRSPRVMRLTRLPILRSNSCLPQRIYIMRYASKTWRNIQSICISKRFRFSPPVNFLPRLSLRNSWPNFRLFPRDLQRGNLIKQSSAKVGEYLRLYLLLTWSALAYFSFWFSARLPAWSKPGSDAGTRSPRMNPIRKEGVG